MVIIYVLSKEKEVRYGKFYFSKNNMSSTDSDIATLSAEEIAPYAFHGDIAKAAKAFVDTCADLDNGHIASTLRAWSTAAIFGAMENTFALPDNPIPLLNQWFEKTTAFIKSTKELNSCFARSIPMNASVDTVSSHVEERTGTHYSRLFGKFSPDSFWDEPTQLLKTRLERNQIDPLLWTDKSVLDAGCGGGRYTVAWKKLGAKSALGLDLSQSNVDDATARVSEAKREDVTFKQGNVLSLPFPDNSFDVVFSNGVLHHTLDWKKGVAEIVRVLKPGGFGWLYLIENPGGLYWGIIEILRLVMKNEDGAFARQALASLGIPANRVFYMLDHVMAPINSLLTPQEIEGALVASGAKSVKRLERGVDFDRIEKIFLKEPYAEVKYGVGENRHIFSK